VLLVLSFLTTSHATSGLRRYSAGHTYKWKYGRVDRKGLLCVSIGQRDCIYEYMWDHGRVDHKGL